MNSHGKAEIFFKFYQQLLFIGNSSSKKIILPSTWVYNLFYELFKKKIVITHIHFLLGIENAAVIPNGAKIIAKIFNNYHYLKTIATKNCNCIFISLKRVAHLCNLNNKRIIQEIPHFGNQWNQKWFTLIES